MTRRMGAILAAAALSATGLAGCGGGDQAYCDRLDPAVEELDVDVHATDFEAAAEQLRTIHRRARDVREVAPEEMDASWASIEKASGGIIPAFEKLANAGGVAELSRQEQRKLLRNVDREEVRDLRETVEDAGDAIARDGEDRCGLDLQ